MWTWISEDRWWDVEVSFDSTHALISTAKNVTMAAVNDTVAQDNAKEVKKNFLRRTA